MFRILLLLVAGALPCLSAFAADKSTPAPTNAVDTLIRDYQADTNVTVRVALLKKICASKSERAEKFLEEEYNNLDSTDDARLLGVLFEAWARQPTEDNLYHLIYQGVFHDETNVVHASALAIVKMSEEARSIMCTGRTRKGKDPSEDLAADFINRMIERPEFIPALERVLVILSRKPRPGFKAGAKLDAKVTAATRKAAVEYWVAWFEKFYGKAFVPETPPKK